MDLSWQEIAVLALVALAAVSVGRRIWRSLAPGRSVKGCSSGSCTGCPAESSESARPLVTIDELLKK